MDQHHTNNWLESVVKRPPSLVTIIALISYSSLKEHMDITDQKLQGVDMNLSDTRGKVDVLSKGTADATSIANLMGSRLDAQAARISGMDTEFATMQSEVRQALRDQVATDKSILDKLGKLEASIASIRADVNWIARIPAGSVIPAPSMAHPGPF